MKTGLTIFATLFASQAVAFEGCTKTEIGQFLAASERAERLTLTATTAIGPNPTFERWFGDYSRKNGEVVRGNLKAIVKVLRSGEVTASCKNDGQGLCASDTFAFVNLDSPFVVNLCDTFFEMDTMKQLTADSVSAGNGTRAGTIIHEVSHFESVSATEDLCYTREECSDMAKRRSDDALKNADSYQYFVEDVTFFGVRGEPEVDE